MTNEKPTGARVGYARTSTVDQDAGLDAQIAELNATGCTKVFSEKVSSVDAQRPELKKALAYLREGDTFIVTRPDRLARNTADLLALAEGLTKSGVTLRILSMDINTSTATGKLLLTLMAGIASFERELMLERQRHGIAAAKAAGKYKGRQPTARAHRDKVLALRDSGIGAAEIVKSTGISRASVYRLIAEKAASA